MKNIIAFNAGYLAAKNGNHIDNCYPYVKGNYYWDWLDGYRSFKK